MITNTKEEYILFLKKWIKESKSVYLLDKVGTAFSTILDYIQITGYISKSNIKIGIEKIIMATSLICDIAITNESDYQVLSETNQYARQCAKAQLSKLYNYCRESLSLSNISQISIFSIFSVLYNNYCSKIQAKNLYYCNIITMIGVIKTGKIEIINVLIEIGQESREYHFASEIVLKEVLKYLETINDIGKRDLIAKSLIVYYEKCIQPHSLRSEILKNSGGIINLLCIAMKIGSFNLIKFLTTLPEFQDVNNTSEFGLNIMTPAINSIDQLMHNANDNAYRSIEEILRGMLWVTQLMQEMKSIITIPEKSLKKLTSAYSFIFNNWSFDNYQLQETKNSFQSLLYYFSRNKLYIQIEVSIDQQLQEIYPKQYTSEVFYALPIASIDLMLTKTIKIKELESLLLVTQKNKHDKVYSNALIMSIVLKNYNTTHELISKINGKTLNITDSSGRDALWYACYYNASEIIRLLINGGARVRGQDTQCYTTLMAVCAGGADIHQFKEELFSNVLAVEPKNGRTALHYLAANNTIAVTEIFKRLMDKGAKINARDKHNLTPLHHAILFNNLTLFRLLIHEGKNLDINIQDNNSNTPLMVAILHKRYKFIEILLNDPRLNVRIRNNEGIDALALLISKSAKPKRVSYQDIGFNTETPRKIFTLLEDYALSYNRAIDSIEITDQQTIKIIRLFLDRGADPGSSYASNWIRDLLFGFLISLSWWWALQKILGYILPKEIAKSIALAYVGNYCIAPIVSKLITNIINRQNETDQNVKKILGENYSEFGLFHLDIIGLAQCRIPKNIDIWGDNLNAFENIQRIYLSLVSRFCSIQHLKYSLTYDGRYLPILIRLFTLPIRIYNLERLQSTIHKSIRSLIYSQSQEESYERSNKIFYDFLYHISIADSALKKAADNKKFMQLLNAIVNGKIYVYPEVYLICCEVQIKIVNEHYNRIYKTFEYCAIEVKKLWGSIARFRYKDSILVDEAIDYLYQHHQVDKISTSSMPYKKTRHEINIEEILNMDEENDMNINLTPQDSALPSEFVGDVFGGAFLIFLAGCANYINDISYFISSLLFTKKPTFDLNVEPDQILQGIKSAIPEMSLSEKIIELKTSKKSDEVKEAIEKIDQSRVRTLHRRNIVIGANNEQNIL